MVPANKELGSLAWGARECVGVHKHKAIQETMGWLPNGKKQILNVTMLPQGSSQHWPWLYLLQPLSYQFQTPDHALQSHPCGPIKVHLIAIHHLITRNNTHYARPSDLPLGENSQSHTFLHDLSMRNFPELKQSSIPSRAYMHSFIQQILTISLDRQDTYMLKLK